jgi:hypothetical protein
MFVLATIKDEAMANKKLVETVHGRRSKLEIYKNEKLFGSTDFTIYKDGSYWKTVDTLSSAVEKARAE